MIASNIDMAVEDVGPICQDTGMPTFFVHTPVGVNQIALRKAIRSAVADATKRGKLRPNSVDSLTGKNTGDNLGVETPVIHFEQWEQDEIAVKLILKGGGCENKNINIRSPASWITWAAPIRNLEGVRKCIHAVWQAQGLGMRAGRGGRMHRKRSRTWVCARQGRIVRTLDDAEPRAGACRSGNASDGTGQPPRRPRRNGIRRQSFPDRLQNQGREPAAGQLSVSVAYECWAFRRLGVRLDAGTGAITSWLYRDPSRVVDKMTVGEGFPLSGREVVLRAPLSESDVRSLKVGDVVLISGEMYTGRDAVHAYLMKNPPPVDLHGAVLYHCGPVMLKTGDVWTVKAAGPTTSSREEPYQADVIRNYGVRAVIGKGGMGKAFMR